MFAICKNSYAEGGVASSWTKVKVKGQGHKHDLISSAHGLKYMHTKYEHYLLRFVSNGHECYGLNLGSACARVDVSARTNGRTDGNLHAYIALLKQARQKCRT